MNKDISKYNLANNITQWQNEKNLILVTHYVVISEALGYASLSGEIVISDKNLKNSDCIKSIIRPETIQKSFMGNSPWSIRAALS